MYVCVINQMTQLYIFECWHYQKVLSLAQINVHYLALEAWEDLIFFNNNKKLSTHTMISLTL